MTFKFVIFHLNILADPALFCAHYQCGLAEIMQQRYGQSQQFWMDIQAQIFDDWNSFHADLNYSGDDAMADMCEGRFRVTRALFRLAKYPEPSKQEITRLADDLISQAPVFGDALFPDSRDILNWLHERDHTIAIVSYYPEQQLRAILCGAQIDRKIAHAAGADSFEHYDMNRRYFEYLLNKLKCRPSECLYVDKDNSTLLSAAQCGLETLQVEADQQPGLWFNLLEKVLLNDL